MGRKITGTCHTAYTKFLMLMLERHQCSGGWVRIAQIQERCEVSRATAYRYIAHAIEAGMPLVMDADDPGWRKGNENLGVRCNLIAATRSADTQVAARRESVAQDGGMNSHTLSISDGQYTPA